MAEYFRFDISPVQCAGHNNKTSVSAFCRLFAECAVESKEFAEVTTSHYVHDELVILRTFGNKSVRTFSTEFMGKIRPTREFLHSMASFYETAVADSMMDELFDMAVRQYSFYGDPPNSP